MDLDAYWQENKGFLGRVAAGLVVFWILTALIGSTVGEAAATERRALQRVESDLSDPMYSRADLSAAADDNEALLAALEVLVAEVDFAPREGFRPETGAVTTNRYLDAVTRVREGLLLRAGRRNVEIEPTLGLPELSPTREDELARTLDALDAIDRLATLAIDVRVDSIDTLRIRLDPSLRGRGGAGALERTIVEARVRGHNEALLELVEATQRTGGQRLLVDELTIVADRQQPDQAQLDLRLVVARAAATPDGEE